MKQPISRRALIVSTLAGFEMGNAASAAMLPLAVSLQQELSLALEKRQPLVVMVSLDGCPFCKVVRENYLLPLLQLEGLPIVQVDMRSQQLLRDFRGQSLSHDAQVRSWRIRLAPTVLFFGRQGREIADRLIGASLPDFYGAYLNDRLQQARAALS